MKKLIVFLFTLSIVTFSAAYGYVSAIQYETLRENVKINSAIPEYVKEELLK